MKWNGGSHLGIQRTRLDGQTMGGDEGLDQTIPATPAIIEPYRLLTKQLVCKAWLRG